MSVSQFTAAPQILGHPDFKIIHIDPEEVAKAFQVYLESASKLTGVSLDDISTTVNELPKDPQTATLADLLERGMKLFDAVVWLTAGRPNSHPLTQDVGLTKEQIPSLARVADSVFLLLLHADDTGKIPGLTE
jgi:uracil DNA glycosylase